MFEGESAPNYEQKCLCTLVLDISSSMLGESINQLNKGIQEFHREVSNDFVASQRLEISIVTFGSSVECVQEPALVKNFQMPILKANGTTKLVDGVRMAMDLVENRKKWYDQTGQKSYRPMIVLITDGEPDNDQDVAGLANEVNQGVLGKHFLFYSLGVKGYKHQKLMQICSNPPPMPLEGNKFVEFFNWLSRSISIITKSKEGDMLMLPPVNSWAQIQI